MRFSSTVAHLFPVQSGSSRNSALGVRFQQGKATYTYSIFNSGYKLLHVHALALLIQGLRGSINPVLDLVRLATVTSVAETGTHDSRKYNILQAQQLSSVLFHCTITPQYHNIMHAGLTRRRIV